MKEGRKEFPSEIAQEIFGMIPEYGRWKNSNVFSARTKLQWKEMTVRKL